MIHADDGSDIVTGGIENGLLVYLGVGKDDSETDAEYLAEKIAFLRIFIDENEKMNLSVIDLGYKVLVVSQFTLFADARKGRRPSFNLAAGNEVAEVLYDRFCECLRGKGISVATGKFRHVMRVKYVNEGPITLILDSRKNF
jgi:D-tyrosyl-tRNA(Tyr) deacylase